MSLSQNQKNHNNSVKNEVYNSDCYKLKKHKFQRKPQHVVDLGANFGWFSLLASETCPDAIVHGYEMVEENYNIAASHLKDKKNINLVRGIVIGENKVTKLRLHTGANLGGHKVVHGSSEFYTGIQHDPDTDGLKQVDAVDIVQHTVGDILNNNNIDYIDFLKMDIEGSEYEVMDYIFKNNLSKRILYIAMEVHGRDEKDAAGKPLPGDSKQFTWLKDQCNKHFDQAEFKGNYAYLSNKLENKNE